MKNKTLTLCVSGKLWNRSLVMLDLETRSLWSHILGEAMDGELKGVQLEIIPADMMTWEAWKKQHPKTTVLSLSPTRFRNYRDSFYAQRPDRFVYGAVIDGSAYHFPWPSLTRHPVQNVKAAETPALVAADPKTTSVRMFDRRVDGKPLEFSRVDGRLKDKETSSLWREDGVATEGPLKGRKLQPLAGLMSFKAAWEKFHPKSQALGVRDN